MADSELKLFFLILLGFITLLVQGIPSRLKPSPRILNSNEVDAIAFLDSYNKMAMQVYFDDVSAAWNYQTDITEENQQKMVRM